MERIGKEWLWRHIYQIKLNGRNTLVAPELLEEVKTKENADELFIYLINEPDPEGMKFWCIYCTHGGNERTVKRERFRRTYKLGI